MDSSESNRLRLSNVLLHLDKNFDWAVIVVAAVVVLYAGYLLFTKLFKIAPKVEAEVKCCVKNVETEVNKVKSEILEVRIQLWDKMLSINGIDKIQTLLGNKVTILSGRM